VFAAMASVVAKKGLGVLGTYAIFIGEFYAGLLLLWLILIGVGYLLIKKRIVTLFGRLKEALLLAFSTASSEAAYPKMMEELERFGCNNRIVSFTLPLGYSFNLDGSMMYMTFASIFIAQAYDIPLDLGTQLTMLLVLMLTSKGIAGVPRASLVVVAATCGMFDIPAVGIALILPIDHFCDMFRSATNVLGNALATSVVGKWEKE
jgi:Na+/H+-dicarboxylate symporter